MVGLMDMENIFTQVEQFTVETFLMINQVVQEQGHMLMVIDLSLHGRIG